MDDKTADDEQESLHGGRKGSMPIAASHIVEGTKVAILYLDFPFTSIFAFPTMFSKL